MPAVMEAQLLECSEILSASTTRLRRMLSLGAFDYVAKPFDLSRLGRMLEAALIYRS